MAPNEPTQINMEKELRELLRELRSLKQEMNNAVEKLEEITEIYDF